jgi:AcrR family transcriptional regulator
MKPQQKLQARERLTQILAAALTLSVRSGYTRITRERIAHAAGVSEALVTYHLGTMQELRRAVMREAVRVECLPVIAQGLTSRDKHAGKASPELKQKALASFGHSIA